MTINISTFPQRPLPDSDETRHQVAIVTAATDILAGAIAPPLACPALESGLIGLDPGGVHFTADYLVDQTGAAPPALARSMSRIPIDPWGSAREPASPVGAAMDLLAAGLKEPKKPT